MGNDDSYWRELVEDLAARLDRVEGLLGRGDRGGGGLADYEDEDEGSFEDEEEPSEPMEGDDNDYRFDEPSEFRTAGRHGQHVAGSAHIANARAAYRNYSRDVARFGTFGADVARVCADRPFMGTDPLDRSRRAISRFARSQRRS
jgi:hypothetical protein